MSDVRTRNAEAMTQTLDEFNEKLEAQVVEIAGLRKTVGTMTEKMKKLEQDLIVLRASTAGRGPTANGS